MKEKLFYGRIKFLETSEFFKKMKKESLTWEWSNGSSLTKIGNGNVQWIKSNLRYCKSNSGELNRKTSVIYINFYRKGKFKN